MESRSFVDVNQVWWCSFLILTLTKQRQMDLCGFKASLVYMVSSRVEM